ncbi:MAG: HD domain-containing protein [Coriobacteriales bacterium]|nr:HD domain-containing protein [Coriobacteriales bacterium]
MKAHRMPIKALRDLPAPPAYALKVLGALEAAGHEAWIVGGWVRDALRGDASHDVDVCCIAPWQESAAALRACGLQVDETGTQHGTITAVCDGKPVEVTTYRVDGAYSDHRHPDEVRFVQDVRQDLARRDLTINAMAFHPTRGLLDPYGGRDDLVAGRIRTVGDPQTRFREDALRILRAVRFSLRLNFEVEPCTQRALVSCAPLLAQVASERAGQEIDAIVRMGKAGRALLEQSEVMCAALPELVAARGFDQRSVWHRYDVYEHSAHVCNAVQAYTAGLATPELQWAALLHDMAKPACFSLDVAGHGHFFDHPRQGALMAKEIMHRLAIPTEITRPACLLIQLHDERMPATERAIRELLSHIGRSCPGQETSLAFSLFNLRRADALSKSPSSASRAHEIDAYARLLRTELMRGPVFSTRHLAVSGADLIRECKMSPGPGLGMQLDMLLNAVMAGEVPNEREALLAWLGSYA